MPASYLFDPALCEIEPIHIPGNIQPHGALIAIDPASFLVVYISDNAEALLGIMPAALGQPVDSLLDPALLTVLRRKLADEAVFTPITRTMVKNLRGTYAPFQVFVHHNDSVLILEFERDDGTTPDDLIALIQETITAIRESSSVSDVCQMAAEAVRALTGHDRVMVYRFDDHDYHGVVIAEARSAAADSFLGLHYPASDIPQMARDLFLVNGVRLIADAQHIPAQLIAVSPTLPPLDLTRALLRGVSPGHLHYLGNMGVRGSMSIAIIREGGLWGLFACHHMTPHFVPRHVREVCRFLGMALSSQIGALNERDVLAHAQRKMQGVRDFLRTIRASGDVMRALADRLGEVMGLADAQGAALVYHDSLAQFGTTPTAHETIGLAQWLFSQPDHVSVFATHTLTLVYPEAEGFASGVSGVLAASLSVSQPAYLLWFRPEIAQTVTWGRQIEQLTDSPPLSPNQSFHQWQQQVRFNAERWQPGVIAAIRELRTEIVDLRVQQAILQNERQMRAVLDTLPSVVFVFRGRVLLYVSESVQTITGYSRDELAADDLWALLGLSVEWAGDFRPDMLPREVSIVRKDGQRRWLYLNTTPITFRDQPAVIGTAFDITDTRLVAQRELEVAIEREHVRILSEFIQDASHDLRTPLSVLSTSLYLLKRQALPEQQPRIAVLEEQAGYLSRLIEDLLTMSRLDHEAHFEFVALDLNAVLSGLSGRMQMRAESRAQQVILQLDAALPPVRGDALELERCFSNLIDNALHYSPSETVVTVQSEAEGGSVVVRVIDRGIGIAPEHVANIFKRFYRADAARTRTGSGLGLAIVKRIVDAHGGTISVESALGQGTTFSVRLPVMLPDEGG